MRRVNGKRIENRSLTFLYLHRGAYDDGNPRDIQLVNVKLIWIWN